jgi:DNA repair exonuclease SbcCD ATPase subunit
MRPLNLRITFEIISGAVVASSLFVVLHQARQLADYRRQKEADTQSLRLLQEALRQKNLQRIPPLVTEETPSGGNQAEVAKREAAIERLDRELAEAYATIADLQSRLSDASDQNSKALAGAEERLQKQQADSQAQIQDLQKKLDDALADFQIARQRVAAVEADNAKLHAEVATDTGHATEFSRTVASLEDLNRRREVYLTSIQRRYRDITGEFRAMSSMLDTSHDPNSNVCSGAVLSRIQNAVTSADDDLRQLNELDARALKLEKQLQKN